MLPMSVTTIRIPLTAPSVVPVSAIFAYQTSPNKVSFAFSQNVSATLSAADVSVTGPGGATIPIALVNYDANNVATFSMPTPLNDGNYILTVYGGGISTAAFQSMPADFTLGFYSLLGDANRDRAVNSIDFNTLASNYGGSGKSFGDGDFNLDGTVNSIDFSMLATRFNVAIPAPAAPISLDGSGQMLLFRHMDASAGASYSPLDEESKTDQIVLY
jgi:hypothetical protein